MEEMTHQEIGAYTSDEVPKTRRIPSSSASVTLTEWGCIIFAVRRPDLLKLLAEYIRCEMEVTPSFWASATYTSV